MPTQENKYLDLTGLQTLVDKIKAEDAKKVDKIEGNQEHSAALYKIGTNSQGLVNSATQVVKSDITGLGIPEADTNQKVKAGDVTFGANDVVEIVAGTDVSVTGNATNKTITIGFSGDPANQKVKSGNVTFDASDVVDICAASDTDNPITVTGDATNDKITILHNKSTVASAAAVKVGRDAYGHVTLGDRLQYSDIQNTPTIGDKTLTITAGSKSVTFSANQSDENKSIAITAADLGLDSAMHFKGAVAELPATTNYSAGDVIVVTSTGKEYVLNVVSGTKSWVELGDEGSYALKTTQVIAGDGLTGGGALSGNVTISHVKKTSVGATAVSVGYDEYGHVVLGQALGTANNGAHTHTVTGSVSVANTVTAKSAKYLSISSGASDTFVKSYPGTSSKLATTSITGVSGSTTASKASAGTAVVYGTADVGTAVVYGKANVGTAVTYGTADRAATATTVITACGFANSGVAYAASYDGDNSCLNLTPLTFNATSGSVYEAVTSEKTLTPAVAAPSTQTLTPAKDADSTRKITPYSFTDVTVPKAATATTVATGTLSDSGTGASVMTGLGTPTTGTALGTASLSVADTSSTGAVAFVQSITTGNTSANLSNGTAASAGEHNHDVTGGAL